jgi:hypothetical protein
MTTKTCTKCKKTKATTEFYKNKSRKDGLQSICKPCLEIYKKTPAGKAIAQKAYAKYRAAMTLIERYALDNVMNTRRRSDLSSADLYGGLTFTEATAMTIPFVEERLRLEAETGVAHHIDHIIPVASGATHTKDNLQVLTASENIVKGATECLN